jgi:hypothetical protein
MKNKLHQNVVQAKFANEVSRLQGATGHFLFFYKQGKQEKREINAFEAKAARERLLFPSGGEKDLRAICRFPSGNSGGSGHSD